MDFISTASVTAALAIVFGITVPAAAREKPIKRSELPPAVEQTVAEQTRGATIHGISMETEDGRKAYEVAMTIDGHARDILIDAAGHVIEVEDEVVFDTLPEPVKSGLLKKAGTRSIIRVEALTKNGALVAYEAVVKRSLGTTEIQVGPDGKPLSRPE